MSCKDIEHERAFENYGRRGGNLATLAPNGQSLVEHLAKSQITGWAKSAGHCKAMLKSTTSCRVAINDRLSVPTTDKKKRPDAIHAFIVPYAKKLSKEDTKADDSCRNAILVNNIMDDCPYDCANCNPLRAIHQVFEKQLDKISRAKEGVSPEEKSTLNSRTILPLDELFDARFRKSAASPNVRYKLSLLVKCEPIAWKITKTGRTEMIAEAGLHRLAETFSRVIAQIWKTRKHQCDYELSQITRFRLLNLNTGEQTDHPIWVGSQEAQEGILRKQTN